MNTCWIPPTAHRWQPSMAFSQRDNALHVPKLGPLFRDMSTTLALSGQFRFDLLIRPRGAQPIFSFCSTFPSCINELAHSFWHVLQQISILASFPPVPNTVPRTPVNFASRRSRVCRSEFYRETACRPLPSASTGSDQPATPKTPLPWLPAKRCIPTIKTGCRLFSLLSSADSSNHTFKRPKRTLPHIPSSTTGFPLTRDAAKG